MLDMKIQITGLTEVQRMVGNIGKQAKYAAARTLTDLAKRTEREQQEEMKQAFHSPTPWITKGTFIKAATKANLQSVVGIKDRQVLYVREHYADQRTARGQKPFEVVLARLGVLPNGYKTVPGAGMKLDRNGNPNRAQLREVIGALSSRMQIARTVGRGKRKTTQLQGYFAIASEKGSHLQPGIYLRKGRDISPVLIFVPQAVYTKRLDLRRVAIRVVNEHWLKTFTDYFQQAMRTAK